MAPLLTDEWLDGAVAIAIDDAASVARLRRAVRDVGARVGLDAERTAKMMSAASELARNHLKHAPGGEVAVVPVARGAVTGLELRVVDGGRGVVDPVRALTGSAHGAAAKTNGLAAVARLAEELDVDVRTGEGTCARARTFAAAVPRARSVGVFGRPYPSERVSGDGAFVRHGPNATLLLLSDGLGHGPPARAATAEVIRAARDAADGGFDAIFAAAHAAARGTRGVALTAALIDDSGETTLAGVGNVGAYLVGPGRSAKFTGSSGVVGSTSPLRRVATEKVHLSRYDALLLYSDGITSRLALGEDLGLLREAPVVVAQCVAERFGRDHDDVLVVVAR